MTEPDPRRLSVVVVTYQSADVIGNCLAAVAKIGRVTETLVVDNGSSDSTVSITTAAGVDLIRNEANLGFSRASNQGARKAGGDVLCFLNPDCVLTQESVDRALALIAPDSACIGVPAFVHEDGQIVDGRQPGYTRLKLLADVLHGAGAGAIGGRIEREAGHHDPTWHWPIGACLFVSRDVFLRLGGFDERFFLYMEDVVLGRSLHLAGGHTLSLDCTVQHASRRGSAVADGFRQRHLDAARIQYARLFHGRLFGAALATLRACVRLVPRRWLR